MALVALAPLSELERRLGGTITDGAERERAAALLSDASTLVRHEAGRTWVDAEGDLLDPPDIAVAVTLRAAVRAWHNPAGVDSTQLGAVSVRYENVWLSAAEREQLQGLSRATGVVSVDLTHGFGWQNDAEGWVPVDYGGGAGIPYADWFPIGY